MAVQRENWESGFVDWPGLPCPSCKVGILKINSKTILKEEIASSKADRDHVAWDPEWIRERFAAFLTCRNPGCTDKVFVCGKTKIVYGHTFTYDDDLIEEWSEHFVPHFFEPAPPVFPIPDECPDEVESELKKAFALIWSDTGSAGNRLRVAVEAILTNREIPQRTKIRNGKRKGKFRYLSLDERIEKFAEKHEEAAEQLMAIKWLGNIGSHAVLEALTRDDLLDAFEHFEYALDLVYVRIGAALRKRAKRIIKKKGPVRSKPRRKKRVKK